MSRGAWIAIGVAAVLLVLDVVLRRRGLAKDRSSPAVKGLIVVAGAFLATGLALLVVTST